MALDRKLINDVLFAGSGGPTYIYGHDFRNPNYKQDRWIYPYDPKKAGEMLDAAGYKKNAAGIRFAMPFFIRLGRGDEEIGTAAAGMWREIGIDVQEFRADYTVFRPSLIGRNATSPWIHSAGAEGPHQPWDWPVIGSAESTIGRPGFNIGFESAFYGEKFKEMGAEPDLQKRIALRNEVAEYTWNWAVAIGTVAVPTLALVNPNKIAAWDQPLNVREAAVHHPELIKLKK
jgi:ABC-type transport system substrate-binding protein